MAIALPPPSAPVLGSVEDVRSAGSEIHTQSWQQNQVHVVGADVVDKARLEHAISTANSLSDVVRQIEAVYYVSGYPAVQVRYALAEPDLYVLVQLGHVTRVEASEPYEAYFNSLSGADPLTDERLEPARTLASVHADRAGKTVSAEFQPEEGGAALVLKHVSDEPKPVSMGIEFGNPGNRFAGRHLINYFWRNSWHTGDQLRVDGRHALTGLNKDSDVSAGYHEHIAGWSRVTPWGLFGLTGRYVGYQQDLAVDVGLGTPTRFTGEIRQIEGAWAYLLSASFNSRWNLSFKGDYTNKDYEVTRTGQEVQIQEYGSVEVGTDYARVLMFGDQRFDLSAGVAVRQGLGEDKTDKPITAADLGYLLFRPTVNLAVPLGEHLLVGMNLAAQISDDTVPEQNQWVMGGVGNVEAFLPGISAGDSGGLARLFAQLPFELFGIKVTPRAFVEYGYVKLENPSAAQSGATQTVLDGGLGLSFKLTSQIEARVSYAESLEESKLSQQNLDAADANLFFSISAVVP